MTQADLERVNADLERLRTENGRLCAERDALVKELSSIGSLELVEQLVEELVEVSVKTYDRMGKDLLGKELPSVEDLESELETAEEDQRRLLAQHELVDKEMMKQLELLGGLEKELGKEILGEMLKADMLVKEALEVSFQNSDIDKIAQISQKIGAKAYDEDIEMKFKFLDKKHETLAQIIAAISDKLQRIQDFQKKVNHVVKIENEMEKLLGRMVTLDLEREKQ